MTEPENENQTLIKIPDMRKYLHLPKRDGLADDFVITMLSVGEELPVLQKACRFDGFVAVFCIRGSFSIESNMKVYEMHENSLIVYVPGSIVRFSAVDEEGPRPEIAVVAATRELIGDVRLDFARLFEEGLSVLDNPCITLLESDWDICTKYYILAQTLLVSGLPNVRDAIKSLLASIFSLLSSLWTSELRKTSMLSSGTSNHSKMVFESFLQLVTRYHNEHRTIGFYADRLRLTPKYLARLVREVSGRTATEWINSVVIVEAKTMLKYTEYTTKEIAARLHFSSVPGFHKFFKDHTGMTPKEWREQG